MQSERGCNKFERPGGAEAVAEYRLARGYGQTLRARAERLAQRDGLGAVIERRPGAVSIDVIDVLRIALRIPQGRLHRARGTVRIDRNDVAGVTAHAEAQQLGINA